MRNAQLELGQTDILELNRLPPNTGGRAINQSAILVDYVHDRRRFASVGSLVDNRHAADLYEVFTRLLRQENDTRTELILIQKSMF